MRLGGQQRPLTPGVADGAGPDLVEIDDYGPLESELALVAPDEAAHAGGHGLLAARQQHVDVEVLELAAETFGQEQGERDARGVVVLAALGAREGDVDQEGDGDDQQTVGMNCGTVRRRRSRRKRSRQHNSTAIEDQKSGSSGPIGRRISCPIAARRSSRPGLIAIPPRPAS